MATPNVLGPLCFGTSTLLTNAGVIPEDFYAQFNLPANIEVCPEEMMTFDCFISILDKLKQLTTCHHPGLWLAHEQFHHSSSPYLELMRHSQNIEQLLVTARQYRHIFSEVTYWDWWSEGDYVFIKRCSFVPSLLNDREHSLYALASCFLVMEAILGSAQHIEYMSLMQSEAMDGNELQRFFKMPIHLQQEFDGFVLKKPRVQQQNQKFDAHKYQKLLAKVISQRISFPQNKSFSYIVKSLITNTLSSGNCNIQSVAAMLYIHQRTLQNRLNREGSNFKQLLTEVRMTIAKRLIVQNQLSLTQMSDVLGYSELAAFSRGFRKYHGCSPKVWRQRQLNSFQVTSTVKSA